MAARAYWRGQIRIALVSIPVEIYAATKSGAQVSFHQIHEPSGKRIRYEKVVPGIGPVDRDEIVKGFEYQKDSYVLLDQEEIDAVKLESKKTLNLTRFVDAQDIDILYYEKPYYVLPADDLAKEAYGVVREALRKTNRVGIGQLAVRGSEKVVGLMPSDDGMVLETLRYAVEVRDAQPFFEDLGELKPEKELLNLAEKLIEEKSGSFDPTEFHDRYVDAIEKLIEKKRKAGGKKILEDVEEGAPASGNVIDLMSALKESVEGKNRKVKAVSRKRSKRKAS